MKKLLLRGSIAIWVLVVSVGAYSGILAHGDQVGADWGRNTDRVELYKCLDGAVATTDGEWINVAGATSMGLYVNGITTATVQMRGYIGDSGAAPASGTHGFQISTDITSDEGYVAMGANDNFTYFKCRVTAWTTGTVDANLVVSYR